MDTSLPELTLPPTLPPFVFPTAGARDSLYADWKPTTGHARRRRVRTSRPTYRQVVLLLSPAQMHLFDTWWNISLNKGEYFFAARVVDLGDDGFVWYRAKVVSPPYAEPHQGCLYYTVSMTLQLIGSASISGPVTTTAAVEVKIDFDGVATPVVLANGEVEVLIDLTSRYSAGAEVAVSLFSTTTAAVEVEIELES